MTEREATPIRELHLRRRRSRVPWIYAVYHQAQKVPGVETLPARVTGQATQPAQVAGTERRPPRESGRSSSVLPTKEGRDVEQRVLDRVLF